MTLQQLRYLVEIAQRGFNVSEAAEALFTSQPGVSKQIKQLENDLGVIIFERIGKRLTGVTEAGAQVLIHARRILAEADNLKRYVDDYTQGQHGALVIATTHTALHRDFGIAQPRIAVLGLNPHAGEDGHLGREELDLIIPLLEQLRSEGMNLIGPLPADTAFLPAKLAGFDTVLAMYHDQGLPVLKYSGFEQAVNLTLGLPYPRVAVDHGTALDLAGKGIADPSSLLAATTLCSRLAAQRKINR